MYFQRISFGKMFTGYWSLNVFILGTFSFTSVHFYNDLKDSNPWLSYAEKTT